MPTTRRSRKRQEREQNNGTQPINKLPFEILADIFVVCARLCVYDNYVNPTTKKPYGDYACQTAVSAVCRQWRSIALKAHQLWSRVTISDPAPWARTVAYLARSGSNTPLDIHIEMTESFWDDLADGTPEARIGQTRDALEFIISHGGATSRWQAIIITTDGYDTQLAAANFLASIPLPELWYLELDFTPSEFDEEYDIALTEATLVKSSPLFQNPPSKLRTITIKGLPNPFLFGHRNQLHLPGLTHLKLDFVGSSPSLLDVSTMLQITSQLTVLHLTFEFTADGVTHGLDSRVPKIRLQHLRELGLLYIKEAFWPLNFVMVLEAPKLDFLQIGVVECEAGSAEFVEYLADGGNKTSPRPVFPSVTHLRAWLGEDDPTALLEALLRAHPRTTRLEVPFIPLDALLVKPFLAPNLQRLRATGLSGPELKKVVDARLNAGLPLKVVEVDPIFGRGIRTTDRKYLSSKVEFHFVESFKDYRVVDDVPSEDENNSWMTRYRGLV